LHLNIKQQGQKQQKIFNFWNAKWWCGLHFLNRVCNCKVRICNMVESKNETFHESWKYFLRLYVHESHRKNFIIYIFNNINKFHLNQLHQYHKNHNLKPFLSWTLSIYTSMIFSYLSSISSNYNCCPIILNSFPITYHKP
jgi:hypothetical protein